MDNNSDKIIEKQSYNRQMKESGHEIELLNLLDKKGLGTDWVSGNIITLVEWLNIASLYILILDKQITYYRKIVNRITITGLILSTITSTISLSQLSIDENEYPNLSLSLKIAFTFTSIFTTIATGSIKILNIQENLDICLDYYQKWNAFAAEISGQLQLPIEIRKNALSIIIKLKTVFKKLFTTRLPLTKKIKNSASNLIENKKFVENSYRDSQGNINSRLNCGGSICCFSDDSDIKINKYFSNRLSVYYMYQDIIISELDKLLKEINKDNKSQKVLYRIDPTKIYFETIDAEISSSEPSSNHFIKKSLTCSLNRDYDMNKSSKYEQLSKSTSLVDIKESQLEDKGENNEELAKAINNNTSENIKINVEN